MKYKVGTKFKSVKDGSCILIVTKSTPNYVICNIYINGKFCVETEYIRKSYLTNLIKQGLYFKLS